MFPLNPVITSLKTEKNGVFAQGSATLDLSSIVAWWSSWFGIGPWPLEDLDYALIERFVRRVVLADAAGLKAVRGRPILFLANHQTAVESLLFSILAGALTDIPCVTIAKAEHRNTWLGRLIREGFAYPGIEDPKVIAFFDRDDKASLQGLIAQIAQDMAAGVRSAMVHVEGTRALSAGHTVEKMSGAFVDMALAVNAPIVPVRFVGGLPLEPLAQRTEFPVDLGQQDIYFGSPILPDTLRSLDYKRRKERVIDAINGLGPAAGDERPLHVDPSMQAAVQARALRCGIAVEDAVLAETLVRSTRRAAPDTPALIAAINGVAPLPVRDDVAGQWLLALAKRLGA